MQGENIKKLHRERSQPRLNPFTFYEVTVITVLAYIL